MHICTGWLWWLQEEQNFCFLSTVIVFCFHWNSFFLCIRLFKYSWHKYCNFHRCTTLWFNISISYDVITTLSHYAKLSHYYWLYPPLPFSSTSFHLANITFFFVSVVCFVLLIFFYFFNFTYRLNYIFLWLILHSTASRSIVINGIEMQQPDLFWSLLTLSGPGSDTVPICRIILNISIKVYEENLSNS